MGLRGEHQSRKIPAQRRTELLELLRSRGFASIPEIAAAIGASDSTVRRDLDRLASEGIVHRSHGGASTVERTAFEPLFRDRRLHNPEEKARIGRHAVTLLERGQSVIFDSSSTVLSAVEIFSQSPIPITAITNDVNIASVLATIPEVTVVVPSGEIRAGSFTLVGSTTQSFISRLHVDVALIGIHAITNTILSEGGLQVAEVKRAMIGAARRIVLLADHSKFGPAAFFEVAQTDVIHELITDTATPESALDALVASTETQVHAV